MAAWKMALMVLVTIVLMASNAQATTYYVVPDGNDDANGLSPETAFATIQKGIDEASNDDTVLAGDGTYEGTGNYDIDFDGKEITVASENGPEDCIVDCNGLGRGFQFDSSEDANSVLEGFTIINGSETNGGGIYLSGASPQIINCIITDCNASSTGGGIYCTGYSDPVIRGCLIYGNSANYGGGLYTNLAYDIEITNCTFGKNSAWRGGAYYYYNSDPNVTNCILWGDSASDSGNEVYNEGFSSPVYSYSALEGCGGSGDNWDSDFGSDGGGNIDSYPFFEDFDANDLHLTLNSPCINAGDPNGDYTGLEDIDGQDRVMDSEVDMGADELELNVNLITNGDFELWSGGSPVGWTLGGDGTVSIDANGFDANCAKIEASSLEFYYIYQSVELHPGQEYIMTTMYKAASVGDIGRIWLADPNWKNSGGSEVGKVLSKTATGIDYWGKLTRLLRIPQVDDYGESTAEHDWQIHLCCYNSDTVCYDNASFALANEFIPPAGCVNEPDIAAAVKLGSDGFNEDYIDALSDFGDPCTDANDNNIKYRELVVVDGNYVFIDFPAFNVDTNDYNTPATHMLLEIMYKDVIDANTITRAKAENLAVVYSRIDHVDLDPNYLKSTENWKEIGRLGALNDGEWKYMQFAFQKSQYTPLRATEENYHFRIINFTEVNIPISYISLRTISASEYLSYTEQERNVRGFYEVELPEDCPPGTPDYDDPNLVVFVRDIMRPIYKHTQPADDEPNSISVFSCWGETEPMTFSIYSENGLSNVNIAVSDLVHEMDANDVISSSDIGIYKVVHDECRFGDNSYLSYGMGYAEVPERLEEFETLSVAAGTSERVWMKVAVPLETAGISEGVYQGQVNIERDGEPNSIVNIEFEILDIELSLSDHLNPLYGYPYNIICSNDMDVSFAAIREAGFDPYLWNYTHNIDPNYNGETLTFDTEDFENGVSRLIDEGVVIDKAFIIVDLIYTGGILENTIGKTYKETIADANMYELLSDANFVDDFNALINEYIEIGEANDIEFIFTVTDEPGIYADRRILCDRLFRLIHDCNANAKTTVTYFANCDSAVTDMGIYNLPETDPWDPNVSLNGQLPPLTDLVDYKAWSAGASTIGYDRHQDSGYAGEYGYYTTEISTFWSPVYNRFWHGLFAYGTDATHVSAYRMGIGGADMYNDFDGGYRDIIPFSYPDFLFVYPTWNGELLYTIGGLEGIREGIKDARYIATLKGRIDDPNKALCIGAQDYLDEIKDRIEKGIGYYSNEKNVYGFYDQILEDISEDGDSNDFEAFSDVRKTIADFISLIDSEIEYTVWNKTQKKWYTTINGAMDDAVNDDEIVVFEGTYYETVDFNGVACTLRGYDPNDWDVVEATIISGASPAVDIDCNATLEGFTVKGSTGAAILCSGGSPAVRKCIAEDATQGIVVDWYSSATVSNCIARDNAACGIEMKQYYNDVTVQNCLAEGLFGGGSGIYVHGGYGGTGVHTITNCTSVGNNYGINISNSSATITNCILWNNTDDLNGGSATYSCIEDCNDASGTGNICGDANDPKFIDDANDNYHIQPDSPCIDAGDPNGSYGGQVDIDGDARVINSRVDIGADEAFLVFNIDANTWYATINDAIDEADSGDVIVVYPGTFYEIVGFGGVACTLRGSDPNDWDVVAATIIDDTGTYPAAQVVMDCNAVLSGLRITGGASGAGVYCTGPAPVISKCIIDGCTRGIDTGSNSSPDISNCYITNSSFGVDTSSGNASIKNCCIYENNGHGIYCYQADISGCTIADNSSTGIYSGGSTTVTNCIIWGNADDLYGCSATYSCIEDCNDASGTGNICGDANDPNFVNAANDNYHIESDSPCIDAGDPNGTYTGQVDIDFETRVMGDDVEMGADEVDTE